MPPKSRFRLFLVGQSVSFFGDQLYLFAIVWWALLSFDRVTAGTTVLLVAALAAVVVAPAAGALVDRSDRFRLLVRVNWVYAVVTLTSGLLMIGGHLTWGLLVAFAVVVAGLDQAAVPAASAVLPALVPADALRSANGSLETWRAVAGIAAPIVAGVTAGSPSTIGWLLVADAATFVLNGSCLARLARLADRAAVSAAGPPTLASAVRSLTGELGPVVRLLGRRRALLKVLLVTTVAALLMAPMGVLVPDAMRGFGSAAAGAAMASFAVGVLLVARTSRWTGALPDGALLIAGLTAIAVGDVVLGWAPSVEVACLGSLLGGAGTISVIIAGRTWFQREVPEELRGRVFSLRFAASTLARPAGLAVGGAVATAVGSGRAVAAIGLCFAVLAAVAAPALLRGTAAGPLADADRRPAETSPPAP